MIKQVFLAFGLCLSLSACVGAPDESAPAEGAPSAEGVGSIQQALPSYSSWRTYYSSSARTTVIGTEYRDCDGSRLLEGSKSIWFTEEFYPCF